MVSTFEGWPPPGGFRNLSHAMLGLQIRANDLAEIARDTADPAIKAHTHGRAEGINQAVAILAPFLGDDTKAKACSTCKDRGYLWMAGGRQMVCGDCDGANTTGARS